MKQDALQTAIVAALDKETSKKITAKNAEEAGKALKFFEGIFGKRVKGKDVLDSKNESADGAVYFKDLKIGDCMIMQPELKLEDKSLYFYGVVITPFIEMNYDNGYHIEVRGSNAEQLAAQYNKEVQKAIRNQQADIDQDQKNLDFLKKILGR